MVGGDDDSVGDRAAILGRRQRFIALALSSLAATCGDDVAPGGESGPQPCLSPPTSATSVSDVGTDSISSTTVPGDGTTTGTPQPCLGVDPTESTSSATDSASTTDGTGDTTGSTGTGSDSGTSADDSTSATSQPCLSPPR